MKQINAKLGKMRKADDWVVYPFKDDAKKAQIQSKAYIAQINLETGKGILAGPHSGGAYNHHLLIGKRQEIQVSPEMIQEIKDANPESGTAIGGWRLYRLT